MGRRGDLEERGAERQGVKEGDERLEVKKTGEEIRGGEI